MVALLETFALEKPDSETKNRVGDFFSRSADRAGENSSLTLIVVGKTGLSNYDERRAASLSQRGQGIDENGNILDPVTVQVGFRAAELPGGGALEEFRIFHAWIKGPDGKELGLGPLGGGVPGSPQGPDDIMVQTAWNDHSGESAMANAIMVDVVVSESLFRQNFQAGPTGKLWDPMGFKGPRFECNIACQNVISSSGGNWNSVISGRNQIIHDMRPPAYPFENAIAPSF